MNKYEKFAFNSKTGYWISVIGTDNCYNPHIDTDTNELTVRQEEDINLTRYQFVVACEEKALGKVSYLKGGKWASVKSITKENKAALASFNHFQRAIESGCSLFVIDLDFNDRINTIRFEYKNNIVDPVEISVNYVEANKDQYYQKVAAAKRAEMLAEMSVVCKTGDNLVNVFWKNANQNVKSVLFELFLDNQQQLIMREKMGSGILFKSVQGLAYGTYYFKLSQFDGAGKLIVETDLTPFSICRPMNGRPTVII